MAKQIEILGFYKLIPTLTYLDTKPSYKPQTPQQKFPPGSLLFITPEGSYRLTPGPNDLLEARNRQGNISHQAMRRLRQEIIHQINEKEILRKMGLLPDQDDDDCAAVLA